MVFSWPYFGCKLISVFILPANTIFRKIERERELSESEIEEEERGREHTPPASQAPAREIAPRKRSNPDFAVAVWRRRSTSPFNFAVRRRRSTSPSRRSRSQSQHRFVIPDRKPRFVVPDRDRRTPKPIVLDPKTDRPPSLPSSLNLTGIWFFFSWVLFVFLNWGMTQNVRKCQKWVVVVCDF